MLVRLILMMIMMMIMMVIMIGKFHGFLGGGPNFFLKIILFFVNMKTRNHRTQNGYLKI